MLRYKRQYIGEYDFSGETHGDMYPPLTRYPATMLPQIGVKTLTDLGLSINPDTNLLDPYCGTGNTLVSGLHVGIHNINAYDINPFAVMIARARTTHVHESMIQDFLWQFSEGLLKRQNVQESIPDMHNIDYWYDFEVAIRLGVVRALLLPMSSHPAYPLFAVAFGELVRQFSLTRQSEFKLWRIPDVTKGKSADGVYDAFWKLVDRVLDIYRATYRPLLEVSEPTVTIHNNAFQLSDKQYELVLTSPPYGDSVTTVSYGQFSLFANIWLGLSDFDARQLDKNLMGGRPAKVFNKSESIHESLLQVASANEKRAYQIASFYDDLSQSIDAVSHTVVSGGHAVYVVANRRAKNVVLPTDQFVAEQFEMNGFKHVITHERIIGNKVMPSKTASDNVVGQTVDTMTREYIVIMRKD